MADSVWNFNCSHNRMDSLFADVRYAMRSFRQRPAFFSLLIGILALGIGACVSVFSLVDGVLLRRLPYRDPQQLVMLTSFAPKPPFDSNGSLSYNDFRQIKQKNRSFSDVAITFRTGWSRVVLTGQGEPVSVQGAFVSPNLFAMFGGRPILGRTFTAEENSRAERVVVISQGLGAQRFGSSSRALGQDLEIGHERWRVVGVVPADFQVPFLNTQLWAPVLSAPGWNDTEQTSPLERPRWDVMARLRPGISLRTAQSEIDSLENALKAALPEFHLGDVRVVSLREHFTKDVQRPMFILFSAVMCLLLIACANVANLLLARSADREREIAIRTALGAGRRRLLRQLATESLALSVIAGILGAVAAAAFVPLLKGISPTDTPLLNGVTLNARGLLFALILSVLLGLLLGITPALRFSRRNLNESLNGAGRSSTEGRKARGLKSSLIASEFALAMILLTGAGLLIRSFVAVLNVNPGFQKENVLTVGIGLPSETPPPKAAQFYRDLMQRIEALPGVQAVGGASNLFFLNEMRTHALRQVEGHAPEAKSRWQPLVWTQITGDYFKALGIPLLRGRFFTAGDRSVSPLVAIVNETLARRYWPGEDPVGKHLKGFDKRGVNDDWLTVVGVVKDTRSGGLERAPFSQIYEVQAQRGEQIGNLVIRTSGNPKQVTATVRTLIHGVNKTATVPSVATMEQVLEAQEIRRRFQTWLISVFSGIALALAALGVFAVMHYSVAAKINEIGVRMALGANSAQIMRLVLGQGTRVAIAGISVGAVAALWLVQLIAGMLYTVQTDDPLSFAASALLLLIVALIACYVPARRAAHVDPMRALHQE